MVARNSVAEHGRCLQIVEVKLPLQMTPQWIDAVLMKKNWQFFMNSPQDRNQPKIIGSIEDSADAT
jgi:hypothetical protein